MALAFVFFNQVTNLYHPNLISNKSPSSTMFSIEISDCPLSPLFFRQWPTIDSKSTPLGASFLSIHSVMMAL